MKIYLKPLIEILSLYNRIEVLPEGLKMYCNAYDYRYIPNKMYNIFGKERNVRGHKFGQSHIYYIDVETGCIIHRSWCEEIKLSEIFDDILESL